MKGILEVLSFLEIFSSIFAVNSLKIKVLSEKFV